MSHRHRDYLDEHLPAMRRVSIDLVWYEKTQPTQLLNGEGFALWYVITKNVQTDILYMSLNGMSEATGLSVQNIRKRLAAFIQAGWLIERGYEKHGKYAETKTYDVVLDVLGVGQVTYPHGESKGGSQSGSQGKSKGESRSRSKGGSRNIATPTPQTDSVPNPIPIPIPNPTPTPREYSHNIDTAPHMVAGEVNQRIENILALCIELECNNTPNVGKGLRDRFDRDYRCLIPKELERRAWLTDRQAADVCYASRHGKTSPTYTRPVCGECLDKNRDIEGLSGLSTVYQNGKYVVCPKCNGDGLKSLNDITRNMFTNLNTKGKNK
jgi:hypothetical protein